MQQIGRYALSALKRTKESDLADIFCDVSAIIFYSMVGTKGAWYFIAIIIAADIFRFFIRGAWYHAPFHKTAYYHNPSKDDCALIVVGIKLISLVILAIIKLPEFFFDDLTEKLAGARCIFWYLIVITTVVETFRCLLLTMHKYSEDWLRGTNGYIGIPNWISITRIAISIIMPHIYMTQCFGNKSNLIATVIMILAIATDAVDGFIARATNSITKVGKYLDPLGDKIIFLPNAIAFIWLLYQSSIITGSRRTMIIISIFITITVARDILFFAWFFLRGRKIPEGIGASLVDKVRMGCICAWLLSMTLSLTVPNASVKLQMTILSIVMIVFTALFSVISIYADYQRLQAALKT